MPKDRKQQYVHEEISFIGNELHSKIVTERVCQLLDLGYKVKVIEHDPEHNAEAHYTACSTTIMATLTDRVDISN